MIKCISLSGHGNYRYFLCLLMYLGVAGMYINLLNAEFVYDILGGLSIQSFLAILLPWAAWLMGEFYRLFSILLYEALANHNCRQHTTTFFNT